ncbi:MAG: AAA family ATPase, partial [Candidatus Eremiobacteraeota bacterium]|nr:AAA family ATPase [Candidatus Eremiobacteraeota bacterium]
MTVAEANDERQSAAVDAPFAQDLAIVGPPGSGKTTALVRRASRLAESLPAGERRVLLLAPSDAGVARSTAHLRNATHAERIAPMTFGDLAFALLHDARARDGGADDVERIDDVRASLHFERAGAQLFALEWTEFDDELDPEITGLRAPERFSAAAFRLIRKLRASLISPDDFRKAGLRGANAFYGRPPNFASA